MNRELFSISHNHRLVRGILIKQIQKKLKKLDYLKGNVDGIFGSDSKRATAKFQADMNLEMKGEVDSNTWESLFAERNPGIFERCLQLTADFEGHNFEKAVGNFDNAGITWGIIGFNFRSQTLQLLLNDIDKLYPNLIDKAFGDLAPTLRAMLKKDSKSLIKWADTISTGKYKYLLEERWLNSFYTLGTYPETKMLQLKYVDPYWKRALKDMKKFNLKNELSAALCFDIAVQNGGISDNEASKIQSHILAYSLSKELEIREVIADVVAKNSSQKWVDDVKSRKMTIATGEGVIHKTPYLIRSWGIGEYPI